MGKGVGRTSNDDKGKEKNLVMELFPTNIIDLTQEDDFGDEEGGKRRGEHECEDGGNFNTLTVVDGIYITEKHKSILLDNHEWLTDEIINGFGCRISSQTAKVHCCSSFFFTKLGKSIDKEWLQKWRTTLRSNIKLILIPINWGNAHWALASYNLTSNTLQYYDSMMNTAQGRQALGILKSSFEIAGPFADSSSRTVSDNIVSRNNKDDTIGLLAFIMSKMKLKEESRTKMDIKVEIPTKQPQQSDGSSCGVFVCWWMARLSETIPMEQFINVSLFRKQILDILINE